MASNSIYQFIGDPRDLDDSFPSRRDVLRFISFVRSSPSKLSLDIAYDVAADRVVSIFRSRGFDSCCKRNVKRLVFSRGPLDMYL